MVIRINSRQHRIVRRLRGIEKDVENLKEEREQDVESTLLRDVAETAIADDAVTATAVDAPGLAYDDSTVGWDRAEYDS